MAVLLLGSAGPGNAGLGCCASWGTTTASSSSATRLLSEIKLRVKETEEDVKGCQVHYFIPLPSPLGSLECRMNCSRGCEVDCCLLARWPLRSAVCHRSDSLTAAQYELRDDKFSDQDTRELSGPAPALLVSRGAQLGTATLRLHNPLLSDKSARLLPWPGCRRSAIFSVCVRACGLLEQSAALLCSPSVSSTLSIMAATANKIIMLSKIQRWHYGGTSDFPPKKLTGCLALCVLPSS